MRFDQVLISDFKVFCKVFLCDLKVQLMRFQLIGFSLSVSFLSLQDTMKTYCLILGLVGYLSALNGQHCRFFQYNVRNKSGQLECVDCPYCPTGQEPILKCAVKTEYQGPILLRCRKCQSGTYKRGSSPTPCRPCIKCPVNRVVLQNCTAFHPGECSERCIPGYYLNHDHYCVECCPCLGDSTDTVEPQCATVPGKVRSL